MRNPEEPRSSEDQEHSELDRSEQSDDVLAGTEVLSEEQTTDTVEGEVPEQKSAPKADGDAQMEDGLEAEATAAPDQEEIDEANEAPSVTETKEGTDELEAVEDEPDAPVPGSETEGESVSEQESVVEGEQKSEPETVEALSPADVSEFAANETEGSTPETATEDEPEPQAEDFPEEVAPEREPVRETESMMEEASESQAEPESVEEAPDTSAQEIAEDEPIVVVPEAETQDKDLPEGLVPEQEPVAETESVTEEVAEPDPESVEESPHTDVDEIADELLVVSIPEGETPQDQEGEHPEQLASDDEAADVVVTSPVEIELEQRGIVEDDAAAPVEPLEEDPLLLEIIPEPIMVTGIVRDVVDFVEIFDQATQDNSPNISVSQADSAGGIRHPAILQHPPSQGESRLSYGIQLPNVAEGERLVLNFSIGLRDGIPSDGPAWDGVRFAVDIDEQRVFSGFSDQPKWQEHLLDITQFAGRNASFAWLTDAGAEDNSNYDWALWGMPRILLLCHVAEGLEGQVSQGWILGQPDSDESLLGGFEFDEPDGRSVEEIAELGRQQLSEQWRQPVNAIAVFAYESHLQLVGLGPATAIVYAGSDFVLQATVQNVGKATVTAPQKVSVTLEGVRLSRDRAEKEIRRIDPGEEVSVRWRVRSFSRERTVGVTAKLRHTFGDASDVQSLRTSFFVEQIAPKLPSRANKELCASVEEDHLLLENEHIRALFVCQQRGVGYARLSAVRGGNYHDIAVTSPLASLAYLDAQGNTTEVVLRPTVYRLAGSNTSDASLLFEEKHVDAQGGNWSFQGSFTLAPGAKYIQVEYQLAVDAPRDLLYFNGPSLQAGDGSFGDKKSFALFPGLEYLEGDETSSSTRDAEPPLSLRVVPHPAKITLPLMAVEHDSMLIGLMWDPKQNWDGEHCGVSAQFASPNWYERQENHLMRLFLPTVPDWVPENTSMANEPYAMAEGKSISIRAQILLDGSSHILDSTEHWTRVHGLPDPLTPPRDDDAEIRLSRHALMHTVWDSERQASQHCVGWASANAPGFATLLWHDYLATRDEAVLERVRLIGQRTLQDAGEKGLVSPANCHILRWEFPFYYGHIEGALEGMHQQVEAILGQQQNDGSWRFHPRDERTQTLGEEGDAVLGTCAHNAWTLLKYARITGQETVLQAGLKALNFMKQYKIPRGAQGWECPLYEPDILAASHAVGAYVEAFHIQGDRRYLHQAEYWARTGLPFLYHWNYEDRPAMLFASIPVFGTTFYTHSWFGVPVQWNGLVYAYHLLHLADCLNQSFWRRKAEGILISAMYQQWNEGPLKGTYPDGLYEYCTDGRGPHINPEDIMANLFALRGADPDIKTQVLRAKQGRIHVSSGAEVSDAQSDSESSISCRLKYVAGQISFTLITGLDTPSNVLVNGELLEMGFESGQGWTYAPESRYLFLQVNHIDEQLQIEVRPPVVMPIGEEGSRQQKPPQEQE